jgi:DNA-binding transcriptional LysR family regulator
MKLILARRVKLWKSIEWINVMHDVDINYADFRKLDLNLLVAFDALLTERHVGRAAERLFIGQPAMSHALARLRTLFDDELFVRTGKRMEPTDLALAVGPRVRAWLQEGADFLLREDTFDPAHAEGLIRLSIPDGLEALILPPLMAMLRTEAPGIGIRVQPLAVENLASALDDDEVDLAVVAVDLPLRNWHRRTEWLRCGFNCIFAPAHLQLPPSPTLADLAACDHVVSSYRGDATSTLDQLFAAHGLSRRVVASLASMASIMGTLRQSPLLTIQPDLQLGYLLDMQGLTSIPLCSNPPVEISIGGVWHHRHDRNARHRYIRERMGSVVRALRAPAG